MAFELAATTATSTAAVSAAVSRAGLTHEDFLQEWNWCWIAQGESHRFIARCQ